MERVPAQGDRRQSIRAVAILVAWWALIGAANFAWLARDTRPPTWDPAIHLTSSVRYRHILQDFFGGAVGLPETLDRLFRVDAYYPPLAPFVASLFSLGMPPDPDTSTWILNQFFLALLMLGTYRLGRRFANSGAGIAAAVAVTSFGGVWQALHAFMLDLPLAATTSLALESLFATQRFARAGRSLWLGVLCGLGMLTKWTFLFFLVVPLIAELAPALFASDRFRRMGHATAALVVGVLVMGPWYLFHLPNLAQEFIGFGFRVEEWRGFPPLASWASLVFYPRALAILMLLPWLCVLLAAGSMALGRNANLRRFALLSVAGLLLLTLLRNKDERYAMPALPAAAVVATALAGETRGAPRGRAAAVGALAVISIAVALEQEPPVRQSWPIADTVDAALAAPVPQRPCVRVIPDVPWFQRFVFEYTAEAQGRSVDVEGGSGFPTFTDAVILKTGDQGPRPEPAEIMAAIAKDEGGFHETFRKTWESALPDGSRVEVYRRDVRPIEGVRPGALVEKLRAAIRAEIARELQGPFSGRIEVDPFSDEETLRGHFRRIRVSARELRLGGQRNRPALLVAELAGELSDITVNPYRLRDGDFELLSIDELTPHVLMREDDVNAWLAASGARWTKVAFGEGVLRVTVRRHPWPSLELVAGLDIFRGENLRFRFEAFRAGGVELPTLLLSLPASAYNPVLKEMPCRIRLTSVRSGNGTLVINEPSRTQAWR